MDYYSDEFIGQWLSGELSVEERTNFENWQKTNPSEKHYFDNVEKVWFESQNLKQENGTSEQERWQRLAEGLSMVPATKESNKMRPFAMRIISIAAAALFMFSTTYYWVAQRGVVTIKVPAGNHQTVTLPGGTLVTLNAESSLKYNKNKWEKNRDVTLTGEGFFDVIPGRPFTIQSEFVVTRVLGTSFNIKARDNKVAVACVTGKVSVQSNDDPHESIILTPGLASTVLQDSLPAQPFAYNQKHMIGWMSHQFVFNSAPLNEVLAEVERQYGVSVTLQQDIGGQLFTGIFTGKTPEKALEIICLTSGLNYSINNKNVTIY